MPTMEQLGNDINKTMGVSTSPSYASKDSPTYSNAPQLLSTLEQDLQKMGEGLSSITASKYRASEYGHKMVAMDLYQQTQLGSKKIDEFFMSKAKEGKALTSKDYEQWIKWKTDFYDQMLTKAKLPDGAKEYGKYYKQDFIAPAIDDYYKSKEALSRNYLATLKSESIEEAKKLVEDKKDAYTKIDFQASLSKLESLGVDRARDILSAQVATTFNTQWHSVMYNGVNSEGFKGELEDIISGALTVDQAFRRKFNAIYGSQVKINDSGEYVKVNKDLTDSAMAAMIKSYQGWIKAFKDSGESTSLGSLIPTYNERIDVNNTPLKEANDYLTKAEKEMRVLLAHCKDGNSKACTKFTSYRDGAYLDIISKTKEIETFETAFREFDTNPESLLNKQYSYTIQVANPLTGEKTSLTKTLPKEDVYAYISKKLTDSLDYAIKTGDVTSANEVALKTKILMRSGAISSKAVSRLSDTIKAFNTGEIAYNGAFENPKQFMASLTSAVSFNQTGDGFRFSGSSWLNNKTLSRISGYYSDLMQRKENGEKGLTDGKILRLLTAYTNSERSRGASFTLNDEQKKTLNAAIGDASASIDDFIDWYVAGEEVMGAGTATVALKYVLSKDKVFRDGEALKEELRKNIKVMDSFMVPIFPDRMVMFVPDEVAALGGDKYKETFYYALNKDIQKYNDMATETINLRDLTDSNVQVRQTMLNGQVYTFVDIFDDSGRRLHTAEVTEEEWLKSLNAVTKATIDKK